MIDPNNPRLAKMQDLKRSDLLKVLNGTYLSRRFFDKSACWFNQKLNNNIKNGKPCEFSESELETLRNALYTISYELQELADELH